MYINTLLNQLNTISVTAALVMNTTAVNNAAPLSNNGISMASETISIEIEKIDRKESLEEFFDEFNSPLKEHVETFIEVADKYDLDYRLLPAIACMESSCGKKLIEGSYNPFGWGIHGNNAIYFESYDDAIETVGKGLKENYLDKGFSTPEEIAPIYTPPNHVNWLSGVNFFINKINQKAVL